MNRWIYNLAAGLCLIGAACAELPQLPSGESMKDIFLDERVQRLIHAVAAGDTRAVEALVDDGVDVNASGAHGITPIWWMVWTSNVEGLKSLLDLGGQTTMVSERHRSPLALACLKGETEMTVLLIANGADVNYANPADGRTPIFDAIGSLKIEIAELLLAHGASLEVEDRYGKDPVYFAIVLSRFDFVYLFLKSKNAPI